MIVRRALFDAVGGLDEGIRWEHDHDLYLRLIDRAETMLLSPAIRLPAQYSRPCEGSQHNNLTERNRAAPVQLRVFDKASPVRGAPGHPRPGRRYKGYTLKRIAGGARRAQGLARRRLLCAPGAGRGTDVQMGGLYSLAVAGLYPWRERCITR